MNAVDPSRQSHPPESSGQDRRVVITGLGLVSPLGCSPESLWLGLSEGRSGIAHLQRLPALEGKVTYGGEARDFTGHIDDFGDLSKELKKTIRKALKMMCRESMMAVAAAQQALRDADSHQSADDPPSYAPERRGVVFGSDYMLSPPEDFVAAMNRCGTGGGQFDYQAWGQTGLREMSPLWMLNYLPNMPASHIAIFNDLRGPNNSLTMREASGVAAIREAAQTIARGHADRMVAGATGTRIHAFKTIHAIQTTTLADPSLPPPLASRPFDAGRTGMVLGEGAGAVVLEELGAARRRGATIYGEVTGTGSAASTTPDLTAHSRISIAHAARAALTSARRPLESLGHVSAHGLATPHEDLTEAEAISDVLGDLVEQIPVVAAKAAMGNLGAGGGTVETIASVLALKAGTLYPTREDHLPDPACRLAVTRSSDVAAGDSFLKVSFTPQGQAAALRIDRWLED
jgi:3-oxoacyl-[acyl-carrier-protein] synthase II